MVSERTELTIPVARISNLKYSKKVASVVIDFNMEICGREGLTLNDIQRVVDDVHELTLRPIQEQFLNQLSTGPTDSTEEKVNLGCNVAWGGQSYKENSLEGRLLSVLAGTPELVASWKSLAKDGAITEDVEIILGRALGKSFANGSAGVAYLSYQNIEGEHQVYLAKRLGDIPDMSNTEPTLRGDKVIAKIRQLFSIAEPKSNGAEKTEAQPETTTSTKKNSKKAALPKTAGAKARAGRAGARVN